MIVRMLVFNLIFVLVFNVLSDWYFYKFFVARLTKNKLLRVGHWVLNALFLIALALLFVFVYMKAEVANSALELFLFFYFLVYMPKLAYMIFSSPALLSKNRRFKSVFYGLGTFLFIVIFAAIIYGGTFGRNNVRVVRSSVISEKLPEAFDGYKIVQLSDSHLGNMPNDHLLTTVLDSIKNIKPDLIIFTGDLVHTKTDEAYKFRDVLSKFSEVAPVFTVLGNHDYGDYTKWHSQAEHDANNRALEQFYKDINWKLMNNSSQVIHSGSDSIALIGVENWGEKPFPQYGKLGIAMDSVKNVPFKILMTHNPNHWVEEVKGKEDITLTLSGHTHAMQLVFNLFGKRYSPSAWRYDYWGGLYEEKGQYINVNEGLGIALMPMRLGTDPEVTVITLKR